MSNSVPARCMSLTILLVLTAATTAPAAESSKGPNTGAKAATPSETATAVETLALADNLAMYGIRQNDPVAVIQAAKIKKSIPVRALEGTKKSEGGGSKGADKSSGYDLSADALLARAESMSTGDATLQGLIKDARSTKSRGAVRGPMYGAATLPAGNMDSYVVKFRGHEQAAVLVSGDGDTGLDLFVTDESGNTVCSVTDSRDAMLCLWTPQWTGPFAIHVRNLGRVYNNYELAVN